VVEPQVTPVRHDTPAREADGVHDSERQRNPLADVHRLH
jgi:hypothetical protein